MDRPRRALRRRAPPTLFVIPLGQWLARGAARRAGTALVLALFAFLGAALGAPSPRLGPRRKILAAVSVQPAPTRAAAFYLPLLAVRVGAPLSADAVAQSIQNLFATGDFADVRAVEYPLPGQPGRVRVIFATTPNYFIGVVRVIGAPEPPTAAELQDASGLELGGIYTSSAVGEAAGQVRERLRGYGFYQAAVRAEVRLDDKTGLASVTLIVAAGPLARIASLRFEVAPPGQPLRAGAQPAYPLASPALAEQLQDVSHLDPGDVYSRASLDAAVRRLQTYYGDRNRLTAAITVPTPVFHADHNGLDLVFRVNPGPYVSVQAEGAGISYSTLRKQVPIFQEHAADAELIEEGRQNLVTYLQENGYFDAQVDYRRTQANPELVRILYLVKPGPLETVRAVLFSGNAYFSDDALGDLVAVRTANILPKFIPGSRGRFSQQLVAGDVAAISDLYRANGFEQVKVNPIVDRNYRGKPNQIAVLYQITEGPQERVVAVTLAGNHAFSAARLQDLLTIQAGQPFSNVGVSADRDAILTAYYNAGYEQARVAAQVRPVGADRVAVAYQITEGPIQYVHRVFIAGERFVRPNVIQHQVRVRPGAPLSQLAMLDTQRNLYDLGLFTDAKVAVQNPSGAEASKNVLVSVHEADRWSFSEGLGVQIQPGVGNRSYSGLTPSESEAVQKLLGTTGYSPLLSFDATRVAMFGREQTLSFSGAYGSLRKRALLSYDFPRFLDHSSLRAQLSTLYDDTFEVRTFRAIREQVGGLLDQTWTPTTHFVYRLDYRRVAIPAGFLIVNPAEFPLLGSPVQIAIASVNLVSDRRDNPLDTHSGEYTTFDAALAKSFRLDNFSRLVFENATYYPVFHNWVLARSTRVGYIQPFGPLQPVSLTDPISGVTTTTLQEVVPLPERFFSGGADSLRGFSINQAGPRDPTTGFPVGGNALFVNNVELRFPIVGPTLGGVGFWDAGNVFAGLKEMAQGLFRWRAPSPTDLAYDSQTLGVGLRYQTPVGPLRFDLGYDLNAPLVRQYAVSNSTPPVTTLQLVRLPRLNFFFSVGQTF